MQAEPLHPHFTRTRVGLEELRTCEPVFRLHRLPDDIVALNEVARVVTKAQHFGQPRMLRHVVQMRDVIEVDDGTEFDCLLELIVGRVIRREHNLLARDPRRLRDDELCDAAAVRARPLLVEKLNDARVRQCLHGEVLAEVRCPRKGIAQAAEVRADLRLVVDVERGRISLDQRVCLLRTEWKFLFVHHVLPLQVPLL